MFLIIRLQRHTRLALCGSVIGTVVELIWVGREGIGRIRHH